jgi:hypothetical protein
MSEMKDLERGELAQVGGGVAWPLPLLTDCWAWS